MGEMRSYKLTLVMEVEIRDDSPLNVQDRGLNKIARIFTDSTTIGIENYNRAVKAINIEKQED